MSAIPFNDQETFAGHKIGISTGEAYFLMIVAFGLTLMNWYHMSNTLDTKLVTAATSIVFVFALYAISGCIAVLEFPVTKSLVTNYRLNGFDFSVFMQSVLLSVIVTLAAGGGIYSNLADADRKDIRTAAHSIQGESFENLKQSLISERNAARALASRMTDPISKQMEMSRANSQYHKALANLNMEHGKHQATRPASGADTGSTMHWVITVFISLLCSLGVVFISGFLAVYYKPLVGKPALSLVSKRMQEWVLNPDDIKSKKYEIDVMGSGNADYVKMEKAPTKAHPKNRPPLVNTRVGAISEQPNTTSERPLNNLQKESAKVDYSPVHYETLIRAVIVGEINPTQKPIKAALVSYNIKFVDDAARQKKAVEILKSMASEGVLIKNPDYAKSGKVVAEYLLNPKFLNRFDVREDAYWDYVAERLDQGKHVEALPGENSNSSQKPQAWFDYEQRKLQTELNKPATVEKVDGGVIVRSGHMMSFTPDWLGDDDHPDNPSNFITSRCPDCGRKGKISENRLLEGNLVECRNGHTYNAIDHRINS